MRADQAAEPVELRFNRPTGDVGVAFSEFAQASESGRTGEFVCECANLACEERLELSLEEYERVRRVPTHFAVKPRHIVTEVERVVERNEQFVVVSKFRGGGIVASLADPRRKRRDSAR